MCNEADDGTDGGGKFRLSFMIATVFARARLPMQDR
jgi:hypothetical protein